MTISDVGLQSQRFLSSFDMTGKNPANVEARPYNFTTIVLLL